MTEEERLNRRKANLVSIGRMRAEGGIGPSRWGQARSGAKANVANNANDVNYRKWIESITCLTVAKSASTAAAP